MISSPLSFAMLAVIWCGLAWLMSVLVLFVLLRSGLAMRLATDVPNHRSLHVKPIPRVGGWGIIPVSLLLMLLAAPKLSWLAAGAGVLAVMSHFDDRGGLSARVRFLVQFVVAATFFMLFRPVLPLLNHWWGLVLLTFGLVWLINLYNFMDGADGLAGGMALVGFLAYALAAAGMGPQAGTTRSWAMRQSLCVARRRGFCYSIFIPRVFFSAMPDRSRWGFWPVRSVTGAGVPRSGPAGFRCWCLRRLLPTPRSPCCAACCVAKNSGMHTASITINAWCRWAWGIGALRYHGTP